MNVYTKVRELESRAEGLNVISRPAGVIEFNNSKKPTAEELKQIEHHEKYDIGYVALPKLNKEAA